MTDVFISYSRRDTEFVRRLFEALNQKGRSVWVDWQGIDYSTKWWEEICTGIEAAENFVLVITQDSLNSEYCHKEIQHARRFGKRIVTVLRVQPDEPALVGGWYKESWESLARENWAYLQSIQYLLFREDDDFDTALASLIATIDKDPEYVRSHTRLIAWASEWQKNALNPSYLLRGDDLQNAEAWLKTAAGETPVPTELQREYIAESRRMEDEEQRKAAQQRKRTRQFQRAVVALGLTTVVALVAVVFAAATTSDALNTRATVEWEATYFSVEQHRSSTLVAGIGIIPPQMGTATPQNVIATVTQVAELNRRASTVETFDDVEMVRVPEGCFYMGSMVGGDTVRPVQEVCFDAPFWIDRFEVTNAQYEAVTGDDPPSAFSDPEQPVDSITWYDARDYCERRGARLPTETEWEYAARGPDSLTYPWGNDFNTDYTVSGENSDFQPATVGSRAEDESWVGAMDMAGNAWEWVSTAWDVYPYDADDGRENIDTDNLRVKRGGAWDETNPEQFRTFVRWDGFPDEVQEVTGFRCARDASTASQR